MTYSRILINLLIFVFACMIVPPGDQTFGAIYGACMIFAFTAFDVLLSGDNKNV